MRIVIPGANPLWFKSHQFALDQGRSAVAASVFADFYVRHMASPHTARISLPFALTEIFQPSWDRMQADPHCPPVWRENNQEEADDDDQPGS